MCIRDRSYIDADDFAEEVGKILKAAFEENIKSATLNKNKMGYKDAKDLLNPCLLYTSCKGTIKTEKSEISLTKNEMLILQHLFNNRGHIVSRDSLMTILWNNAEYINENALTVNVSRIRSKLSELGYEDVIETRKGQGYILV